MLLARFSNGLCPSDQRFLSSLKNDAHISYTYTAFARRALIPSHLAHGGLVAVISVLVVRKEGMEDTVLLCVRGILDALRRASLE